MRRALVSNATFNAIMGVYGIASKKGRTSADALEIFISLLVQVTGMERLEQWARPVFQPSKVAYAACSSTRYVHSKKDG